MDSPCLNTRPLPYGRVAGELALAGSLAAGDWALDLQDVAVRGTVNGLPAAVHGFASLSAGNWVEGARLVAEINGASLQLIGPAEEGERASLGLRVADLGRWQEGAAGRLDLRLGLPDSREKLVLQGSAGDLEWLELALGDARLAGELTLSRRRLLNAEIGLGDLVWGDWRVREARLVAEGDADSQRAELALAGDLQGRLQLAGTWGQAGWQGQLAPTRVETPLGTWRLDKAVAVSAPASADRVHLGEHCWRNGETRLCPGAASLGGGGPGQCPARRPPGLPGAAAA